MMNYVNIDITVTKDKDQDERYLVAATTRGRGTELASFHLRQTLREDLEQLLRKLHARTAELEDERSVQSYGEELFNALIQGRVRTLYDERIASAQQHSSGLRICLHILPPELISLPWEMLYDRRQSEYLCLNENPKIVFLRRPAQAQVRRTRPANYQPPLRVLVMTAKPTDRRPLGAEQEEADIQKALEKLIDEKQVLVERKPGTTLELQDLKLSGNPVHTYHLICHGSFDAQNGEGQLVFENEKKTAKVVSASRFRRSLPLETRLVCLNGCQTGQGDESNPLSSIAASLASKGIPAVVGMQFKISDPAAVRFAKTFYTSLAKGYTVDEAVADARLSIATAEQSNHLDWAAPILYMGSSNNLLFKKAPSVQPAMANPPPPSQQPAEPMPPSTPAPSSEPNRSPARRFSRNITTRWKAFPRREKIVAIVVATVVLLGLVAGILIATRPHTTTTYIKLGGVDVSTYCTSVLHYAEAVPATTSSGYYCSGPSSLKINMTQACNWQYPQYKNTLTALTSDHKSPVDWKCYTPQHTFGKGIVDMDGFCQSQGYDRSHEDSPHTDTWSCLRQPQRKVDMIQACIWQYPNGHVAQAREIDNDNSDWKCYGLSTSG